MTESTARIVRWVALHFGGGAMLLSVGLFFLQLRTSAQASFLWPTFLLGLIQFLLALALFIRHRWVSRTSWSIRWSLADVAAGSLNAGFLLLAFHTLLSEKKFWQVGLPMAVFFTVGFFLGLCAANLKQIGPWRYKLPYAYGVNLLSNALLVTGAVTTHLWTVGWEGRATIGALAAGLVLMAASQAAFKKADATPRQSPA